MKLASEAPTAKQPNDEAPHVDEVAGLRQRWQAGSTSKTVARTTSPGLRQLDLPQVAHDVNDATKSEKLTKQCALHEGWVVWAWEEGHDMMLSMLGWLPGVTDNGWRAPILQYNPLYWLAWAPSALMLVGGRLVHFVLGEGGPVRDDESEAEHEARVVWIYANDCVYTVSLLMDLRELSHDIDLMLWHRYVQDGHAEATGTLLSAGLLVAVIAGNVSFYESMRHRCTAGVRAAITGNAGFAFAMTVALAGTARKKGLQMLQWSWFMRAVAVAFAIMAVPAYGKLWHAYDKVPGNTLDMKRGVAFIVIPFLLVVGLMAAAFRLEAHAVWETFG